MIILILSCHKNAQRRLDIENTWAKKSKYFFVLGNNKTEINDQNLHIEVPDDYEHLREKQAKAIRFIHNLYPNEYLFCCDDDTYAVVERLFACEKSDYRGNVVYTPYDRIPYAYGGSGFLLSPKALDLFSSIPENTLFNPMIPPWADACVGIWMNLLGITCINDNRFNRGKYHDNERKTVVKDGKTYFEPGTGDPIAKPHIGNDLISCHFVNDFYEIYNAFQEKREIKNKYKLNYNGRIIAVEEKDGKWNGYDSWQEWERCLTG